MGWMRENCSLKSGGWLLSEGAGRWISVVWIIQGIEERSDREE